jgi:hypothetical protein
MLPDMSRLALLVFLVACGNGSKSASDQQKTPETTTGGGEKIAVPGAGAAIEGAQEGAAGGDPAAGSAMSTGALSRAQNPRFHLKPEEGTLTIGKVEGKAGTPATAEIKLAPANGFKLATDYPIKLQLEAPDGVTLEKAVLSAGGRNKTQGDAAALSEQALAFAVKATPQAKGSYEIKGVFQFGVCENDSCHPRTQPITIQVAAN